MQANPVACLPQSPMAPRGLERLCQRQTGQLAATRFPASNRWAGRSRMRHASFSLQ